MSNAAVFLGGADVSVAAAGALGGSGAVGNPLTVEVDGDTISIVGNQLVADVASAGILHQATLSLDNAAIIALSGGGASPEIITTPGANKGLIFISGVLRKALTTAYTGVTSADGYWGFYLNDGKQVSNVLMSVTGEVTQLGGFFGDTASNSIVYFSPLSGVASDTYGFSANLANTTNSINKGLFLQAYNNGAPFGGGNAANTVIASVTYLIFNALTGVFE